MNDEQTEAEDAVDRLNEAPYLSIAIRNWAGYNHGCRCYACRDLRQIAAQLRDVQPAKPKPTRISG